jgi:hypothetical protein
MGWGNADDLRQSEEVWFYAHLTKPLDMEH